MSAAPDAAVSTGQLALDRLLADVATWVGQRKPHLIELLQVFAKEARFARSTIDGHLRTLPAGAAILEVGAGLMLMSCHLREQGFDVCALEPIGHGFSGFSELQGVVLEFAHARGIAPRLLPVPVERLEATAEFDFAFSLNVMEHVDDVGQAIACVARALRPGARYVFVCPNYTFPYEPHFNLPTFGSKRLTERILGRRILSSPLVPDPAGTWKSLNWISVHQVARLCRRHPELDCNFDRSLLATFFERAVSDPDFATRRGGAIRWFATAIVRSGLVKALRFIPAGIQPVMMCTLAKGTTTRVGATA